QQKAFAEQQAKAMQDAMEAQRKFAEQFTADRGNMPAPFAAPFQHEMPEMPEMPAFGANHDEIRKQMEDRRAEMVKEMEERRAAMQKTMEERRAQRNI
ncbi:MAG: hypothetical protein ABW120_12870, partial [Sedimenticola sp.]